MARTIQELPGIDLFVPVRNEFVGSNWPKAESGLVIPALPQPLAFAITERRFSLRSFVLGDTQHLNPDYHTMLSSFLFEVLSNLGNLEPLVSLKTLRE